MDPTDYIPVKLDPIAAEKILQAIAEEPGAKGIRIGVQGGGCSGYTYTMDFIKEEPRLTDWVSTQGGVLLVVDEISGSLLDGTTIEYEEKLMGGGFRFNNPKATRTCGCGESFSA